ncbi:MAG: hypothetical protein IH877_00815 [Gemmatimonadetes bacterium]|nr:hypothetical protein [Gemmatimonadota bacterium]
MPHQQQTKARKLDVLLEERGRLEEWLARLDDNDDDSSAGIRDRVREDYQRRLLSVLSQVKKFSDQLQRNLDRAVKKRDELLEQQQGTQETYSEAELRFNVGEFDENAWVETKDKLSGELDALADQLDEVESEIEKLEGFLAEATALPKRGGGKKKPARKVPEKSRVKDTSQTDAFDAGSVTEEPQGEKEEKAGASEEPAPAGEPVEEVEEPVAEKQPEVAKPLVQRDSAHELEVVTEADELGEESGGDEEAAVQERTLECPECSKMNLPTEWYCEDCGAELAAL